MLWLRALKARSTGRLGPILFLVLGLALLYERYGIIAMPSRRI
jgi:hypothetical protein